MFYAFILPLPSQIKFFNQKQSKFIMNMWIWRKTVKCYCTKTLFVILSACKQEISKFKKAWQSLDITFNNLTIYYFLLFTPFCSQKWLHPQSLNWHSRQTAVPLPKEYSKYNDKRDFKRVKASLWDILPISAHKKTYIKRNRIMIA